nr:hypothetical protein [Tanacetum cinerariifolium]
MSYDSHVFIDSYLHIDLVITRIHQTQAPPSLDYVPGPEHPPSPDYVPGPEEIEQVPLSPDYAPEEDHPLLDDALHATLSADYPTDRGDDVDDESSDDE